MGCGVSSKKYTLDNSQEEGATATPVLQPQGQPSEGSPSSKAARFVNHALRKHAPRLRKVDAGRGPLPEPAPPPRPHPSQEIPISPPEPSPRASPRTPAVQLVAESGRRAAVTRGCVR